MNMTRATVHRLIAETHPQPNGFHDESELVKDLGFDGLDFVTLALALEDEFGIDVTDEQIMHCENMNDVVSVVEALAALEGSAIRTLDGVTHDGVLVCPNLCSKPPNNQFRRAPHRCPRT